MTDEQKKRTRVIFDTSEVVQVALQLRAVKNRCSVSDILNELVLAGLADDIEEAKRYAVGNAKPPPGRRGRKPKPPGKEGGA